MRKKLKDLGSRLDGNNEFLVKHEMMPIVNYKADGAMIMQEGAKVFLAAGKMTLDKQKYYGRPAPILAVAEAARWRAVTSSLISSPCPAHELVD